MGIQMRDIEYLLKLTCDMWGILWVTWGMGDFIDMGQSFFIILTWDIVTPIWLGRDREYLNLRFS